MSEPYEILNKHIFGKMLESATDSVVELCGARPGDKTLIDALVPAIHNFNGVINKDGTFEAALKAMVKGAGEGRDSTINLVALKGRSSRLGERSKGVMDAGAASCYLILEAMSRSITELIRKSQIANRKS
jgi:dihydroxyacetone kinase-like protein